MEEYGQNLDYALTMDANDPIHRYRSEFIFPKDTNGQKILYFCGNSLGLQPRNSHNAVNNIMQQWASLAVKGHFMAEPPWMQYHEEIEQYMADIVGAKSVEVALANTLTVNLHFLLVSFYRPTKKRFKVLMEHKPFPSDRYAVASQVKFHGFDPDNSIIEVKPEKDSYLVRTEDLISTIEENRDELAMILLGGINYYTGQFYDIPKIAEKAAEYGICIGLDLAHAAGNVEISLHKDNIDFACWCTYKYLNGGPGSLAGLYVHEKHHHTDIPRFEGWWGNRLETRFEMRKTIDPAKGAEAWVVSNPPILGMASLRSSLQLFQEIGLPQLRKKSISLTGYMEYLLNLLRHKSLRIISPFSPEERGCQLSIEIENGNKNLFKEISARGVIADWREPAAIRFAPAPIYNSFEDVFRLYTILDDLL